jgi:hypothetical protein
MTANQWQFPLAGKFRFQFEHPLPIPQRPIREERRRTQLNTYLQEQFDLSQPGGAERVPYDQPGFNSVARSSRLHGVVSSLLQSFRKGAGSVSNTMLSCLFGLIHYGLKLPFNAIRTFIVSLDWCLVLAFFFAVILSPLTITGWSGNEDRTMRLAADLEYELVQDLRRWGMAIINAPVFRSCMLTYLAVCSCSQSSP